MRSHLPTKPYAFGRLSTVPEFSIRWLGDEETWGCESPYFNFQEYLQVLCMLANYSNLQHFAPKLRSHNHSSHRWAISDFSRIQSALPKTGRMALVVPMTRVWIMVECCSEQLGVTRAMPNHLSRHWSVPVATGRMPSAAIIALFVRLTCFP